MPAIYLAVQAVRTVRLMRYPLFQALKPATQSGILKIVAKETLKGAVGRGIAWFTLGLIIDPYNRIAVPLSRGELITSREASANIVDFNIDLQTVVAVVADPLSGGLSLTRELTDRITEGTRVDTGDIKGSINSLSESLYGNIINATVNGPVLGLFNIQGSFDIQDYR